MSAEAHEAGDTEEPRASIQSPGCAAGEMRKPLLLESVEAIVVLANVPAQVYAGLVRVAFKSRADNTHLIT